MGASIATTAADQTTAAKTYKIQFERPRAKGDKYSLSLESKYRQEMGGEINEGVLTFEGTVVVMDVNATGEPTMMMVHVDKARDTDKGKPVTYKIEGADLGVSFQKNHFVFTARDGRKIPPEEEAALSMVVFSPPTGENKDEYLSPGREVAPGENWKLNTEALARVKNARLPDPKKGLDPKTVSGSIQFVGIEDWQGIPCQHLKLEVTVTNSNIPKFVGESFMQVKQELWLPVDISVKKSKSERVEITRQKGKFYGEDSEVHDVKGGEESTTKTTIN